MHNKFHVVLILGFFFFVFIIAVHIILIKYSKTTPCTKSVRI